MGNNAYWKTSLKILAGFSIVFLMAFVSTRQSFKPSNTVVLPSMDTTLNFLQFHDKGAIEELQKKWKTAARIVFVHTGDSHVQPDHFPNTVRRELQTIKGDGGLGFIFPYSAAQTYSSCVYTTKHSGEWSYAKAFILPPKIPLGVTGMAIKTAHENSNFEMVFKQDIGTDKNKIQFYYNHAKTTFLLNVVINEQIYLLDGTEFKESVPEIMFDGKITNIRVSLKSKRGDPVPLEFYGINIENANQEGVVYHNAGVGAAQYKAILHQKKFASQLNQLKADVVVVDYGTNDYLYTDKIEPTLQKDIQEVIRTIKDAVPHACIVLTTAQDLFWKKKNCRSAEKFVEMIKLMAKTNNCLFYDWFHVSGGQGALLDWQQKGYAQKDMIHLTRKGYELKGKLFARAILNTIRLMEDKPETNAVLLQASQPVVVPDVPPLASSMKEHIIQKGESLSKIARLYKVTIQQLMEWNHLTNDRITAGDVLLIGTAN